MAEILPSIFGADFGNIEEAIKYLEKEKTNILHVDMMDGNFVPNIAFGHLQIKEIMKMTDMILDVHMMVQNPFDHVYGLIDMGIEMICVHFETTPHIHRLVKEIRKNGAKAGIALTPSTKPEDLEYLLDDIDYILVMTINPGHSGENFIEKSFDKIRKTKELIGNRDILIEIDGGVNPEIAKQCKAAGVDLMVVGGALFSANREEQYRKLREAIK